MKEIFTTSLCFSLSFVISPTAGLIVNLSLEFHAFSKCVDLPLLNLFPLSLGLVLEPQSLSSNQLASALSVFASLHLHLVFPYKPHSSPHSLHGSSELVSSIVIPERQE